MEAPTQTTSLHSYFLHVMEIIFPPHLQCLDFHALYHIQERIGNSGRFYFKNF